MILSASRRTDIPCYYADWFYNRIKEGFLYVRNPVNRHQVSEIRISPKVVDCIVFWTKNPAPMFPRMDELKGYPFYFQCTLTPYGTDIEPHVLQKKGAIIPAFQTLSARIGPEKVIWRYDPILFNDKYTPAYHINAFAQIAGALRGYTGKCVISFVDRYAKNRKSLDLMRVYDLEEAQLAVFAKKLCDIARENGMEMVSCTEKMDLESYGITHSCCIDKKLIESIIGCQMHVGKDRNQRAECGCMESIDVGVYDTCPNGCVYCYANHKQESVAANSRKYNPSSPLLCGEIEKEDNITVRQVKSVRDGQLRLDMWRNETVGNQAYTGKR